PVKRTIQGWFLGLSGKVPFTPLHLMTLNCWAIRHTPDVDQPYCLRRWTYPGLWPKTLLGLLSRGTGYCLADACFGNTCTRQKLARPFQAPWAAMLRATPPLAPAPA